MARRDDLRAPRRLNLYFRLLARAYADAVDVSDELVVVGLARPYSDEIGENADQRELVEVAQEPRREGRRTPESSLANKATLSRGLTDQSASHS